MIRLAKQILIMTLQMALLGSSCAVKGSAITPVDIVKQTFTLCDAEIRIEYEFLGILKAY